jgi:hypothetical protein
MIAALERGRPTLSSSRSLVAFSGSFKWRIFQFKRDMLLFLTLILSLLRLQLSGHLGLNNIIRCSN